MKTRVKYIVLVDDSLVDTIDISPTGYFDEALGDEYMVLAVRDLLKNGQTGNYIEFIEIPRKVRTTKELRERKE